MTSRDFCYWLQGYFELQERSPDSEVKALGAAQVRCIQQHLALVFKHEIDPSAGDAKHQAELNAIHSVTQPSKIGGVGPDGQVYRC